EGDDILVLRRDIGGSEGFGQPKQHAAQHRAGYAADAAQHGGRERLDAGDEAYEGVQLADSQCNQYPAHRSQHGANDEGKRDDAVGVYAQQVGHAQVLRTCPGRAPDARILDEQRQRDHENYRDDNDHDARIRRGDHEIRAQLELHRTGDEGRDGHVARPLANSHPVLKKNRHADGRNQRHQSWPATQRCIRDFFDCVAVYAGNDDGHHQHDKNNDRQRQAAIDPYGRQGNQAHIGTDHVDLAMCEVDHADNAVHHGVANGDERVNGAERQAVKQLLRQLGNKLRHKTGDPTESAWLDYAWTDREEKKMLQPCRAGAATCRLQLQLFEFACFVPLEDCKFKLFQVALGVVLDLADSGVEGIGVHVVGHLGGVFTDGIDAVHKNLDGGIGGKREGTVWAAFVFLEVFQHFLVAWQLGEVGWQRNQQAFHGWAGDGDEIFVGNALWAH